MRRILLLPLLLLVACQEASYNPELNSWEDPSPGIVGGTEVAADDPLMNTALLFRRLYNRKEFVEDSRTRVVYSSVKCTSSALNKRIILLAAHCVTTNPDEIYRLEIKNAENKTEHIKVAQVIIHPDYEKDPQSDLALAVLEKDLPANIIPVELTGTSWPMNVTSFTAAGYGVTTGIESLATTNNTLRTTPVKIFKYKENEKIFTIDQTSGKGICSGDSGGPGLLQMGDRMLLLGVASGVVYYNNSEGLTDTCNYLGEYVNVPLFYPWITETVEKLKN